MIVQYMLLKCLNVCHDIVIPVVIFDCHFSISHQLCSNLIHPNWMLQLKLKITRTCHFNDLIAILFLILLNQVILFRRLEWVVYPLNTIKQV